MTIYPFTKNTVNLSTGEPLVPSESVSTGALTDRQVAAIFANLGYTGTELIPDGQLTMFHENGSILTAQTGGSFSAINNERVWVSLPYTRGDDGNGLMSYTYSGYNITDPVNIEFHPVAPVSQTVPLRSVIPVPAFFDVYCPGTSDAYSAPLVVRDLSYYTLANDHNRHAFADGFTITRTYVPVSKWLLNFLNMWVTEGFFEGLPLSIFPTTAPFIIERPHGASHTGLQFGFGGHGTTPWTFHTPIPVRYRVNGCPLNMGDTISGLTYDAGPRGQPCVTWTAGEVKSFTLKADIDVYDTDELTSFTTQTKQNDVLFRSVDHEQTVNATHTWPSKGKKCRIDWDDVFLTTGSTNKKSAYSETEQTTKRFYLSKYPHATETLLSTGAEFAEFELDEADDALVRAEFDTEEFNTSIDAATTTYSTAPLRVRSPSRVYLSPHNSTRQSSFTWHYSCDYAANGATRTIATKNDNYFLSGSVVMCDGGFETDMVFAVKISFGFTPTPSSQCVYVSLVDDARDYWMDSQDYDRPDKYLNDWTECSIGVFRTYDLAGVPTVHILCCQAGSSESAHFPNCDGQTMYLAFARKTDGRMRRYVSWGATPASLADMIPIDTGVATSHFSSQTGRPAIPYITKRLKPVMYCHLVPHSITIIDVADDDSQEAYVSLRHADDARNRYVADDNMKAIFRCADMPRIQAFGNIPCPATDMGDGTWAVFTDATSNERYYAMNVRIQVVLTSTGVDYVLHMFTDARYASDVFTYRGFWTFYFWKTPAALTLSDFSWVYQSPREDPYNPVIQFTSVSVPSPADAHMIGVRLTIITASTDRIATGPHFVVGTIRCARRADDKVTWNDLIAKTSIHNVSAGSTGDFNVDQPAYPFIGTDAVAERERIPMCACTTITQTDMATGLAFDYDVYTTLGVPPRGSDNRYVSKTAMEPSLTSVGADGSSPAVGGLPGFVRCSFLASGNHPIDHVRHDPLPESSINITTPGFGVSPGLDVYYKSGKYVLEKRVTFPPSTACSLGVTYTLAGETIAKTKYGVIYE